MNDAEWEKWVNHAKVGSKERINARRRRYGEAIDVLSFLELSSDKIPGS